MNEKDALASFSRFKKVKMSASDSEQAHLAVDESVGAVP